MAFALKRKESVPKAFHRLGRSCAKKALRLCEEKDLESIHCARKQIKKLRALLRLVRDEIGKRAFEKAAGDLREAAGHLAPPRDAHVQLETLEKLIHSEYGATSTAKFARFYELLKRGCREELATFRKGGHAKAVERVLREVPDRFEKLPLKSNGWSAIGPGLKKSYGCARQARLVAQEEPSAENLHTWRKRVKDLACHIQLLEPIWPEQMAAMAEELDRLGECLGDEQDLHVLRQTAIKRSVDPDLEAEAAELLPLIERPRLHLRNAAFAASARFFSEKPSEFGSRIHRYWKLWKAKKTRPKRSKPAAPRARSLRALKQPVDSMDLA